MLLQLNFNTNEQCQTQVLGNFAQWLFSDHLYNLFRLKLAVSHVRRGRPKVFCKKVILRNFAKFTGKHLCQRLFFNKVTGLRSYACNFIKKESLAQVFFCELCEISKNAYFTAHLCTTSSDMPKSCNFIKKGSLAQVFSCEFCEISKKTIFYRTTPVVASIM